MKLQIQIPTFFETGGGIIQFSLDFGVSWVLDKTVLVMCKLTHKLSSFFQHQIYSIIIIHNTSATSIVNANWTGGAKLRLCLMDLLHKVDKAFEYRIGWMTLLKCGGKRKITIVDEWGPFDELELPHHSRLPILKIKVLKTNNDTQKQRSIR